MPITPFIAAIIIAIYYAILLHIAAICHCHYYCRLFMYFAMNISRYYAAAIIFQLSLHAMLFIRHCWAIDCRFSWWPPRHFAAIDSPEFAASSLTLRLFSRRCWPLHDFFAAFAAMLFASYAIYWYCTYAILPLDAFHYDCRLISFGWY